MDMQVLPRLKEKILIERARMRLKAAIPLSSPEGTVHSLRDFLKGKEAKIESEDRTPPQV